MSDSEQSTDTAAEQAELSKELEVLGVMRKVLGSIIRDTTPEHRGMKHVLNDGTIEDIKQCFALIAAREREIHEDRGVTHFPKPHYPDSPRKAQTVGFTSSNSMDDDEIH